MLVLHKDVVEDVSFDERPTEAYIALIGKNGQPHHALGSVEERQNVSTVVLVIRIRFGKFKIFISMAQGSHPFR